MTQTQEKHLFDLLVDFNKLAGAKYRRGAAHHNGDLLDMTQQQLINEAIDEAIDQVIYLLTLRKKFYG